ncbi:MAG: hybrid sensor histidine kinase/response regulator [Maioricimonas sp. JB045]|uniref:sensor histidine kinase n=1 Tax=Maioricimonas sp. JC845 TaxID=3232138 RepID=UPI0034574CBA
MTRDILYVDDEETNLIVFESAFEDDFNIHTATSAAEALEILEEHPIPVVVADQRMPEMTGVEMFAILRQKYPHTQRVILTGYADSEAIIDAINEGQVYQYVRKPWQRIELLAVLRRALQAHDLSLQNSVLTDRLLVSERSAMLGQATARIAHEMSNQLNVLPLLEVIEDEYAQDEQLVQLAEIARSTYERLTELVSEVKDFMRFDTKVFDRQSLNLTDCVQELVSFLRFHRSVPHDRLRVKMSGAPVVNGNKLKLHQVMLNLVQNAADAIEGVDEGMIELTLGQLPDRAVICISDNGCGIAPETLKRIWEPFFTTKGPGGNGMGLDITRQLVESHEGVIECTSSPGQGARFTIYLPLAGEQEHDGECAESGTTTSSLL